MFGGRRRLEGPRVVREVGSGPGSCQACRVQGKMLGFCSESEMGSHCCVSAWSNSCFLLLTLAAACKQSTGCPGGKLRSMRQLSSGNIPEAWTRMVVMEVRT